MKDQHTRMLHGRLLRPLKVGSSALIDHEGQFILTSLVTSIQVQNEQEAKFETHSIPALFKPCLDKKSLAECSR